MTRRWLSLTVYVLFAVVAVAVPARAETIHVRAGDDLQAALNGAQPGDILLLEAGATFTGNFVLPAKTGGTYITVRSAAPDTQLPGPGVRIGPAHAPLLPKIRSTNNAAAMRAAPGAHHWRLLFLEFPATYLGYGDILRIGEGSSAQSLLTQVPYEFDIDRVYVHGHPLYGQKRGIALNGRSVAIRNSYVSDIKQVGFDTQAIGGWNGPGPFTIENNYLEGAGENFILGGSDPPIPNLVSEHVVVRRNYMTKPLSWREPIIPTPNGVAAEPLPGAGGLPAGTYTYQVVARRPVGNGTTGRSTASEPITASLDTTGAVRLTWTPVPDATEYRVYGRSMYWTVSGPGMTDVGNSGAAGAAPTSRGDVWQVKNVFELKNARHVVVEYNIFENNWQEAQPGYAILFTPRNQDGRCTWCVVEDVTFQFNVVRHTASGINLSGYDWPNLSAQTNNVRIRHNVFFDISQKYGGAGWFLLIGDQPRDITVDHNTVDFDGTTLAYAHGGSATAPKQITGFIFTNNATRHNQYGINAAGFATGSSALNGFFPGAVVQGNWLQGGIATRYPAGNFFTGAFETAFADPAAGDYRPASGCLLHGNATDGTAIGADVGTLAEGLAGVIEGTIAPRPNAPTNLRIITR